MRIFHVITTLERAGAENHLRALIELQINAGDTVACAYLKGSGYWSETLAGLGAEIVPLGMAQYGDPRTLVRLRRAIARFAPDVVHAHLQPAELYSALALQGLKPRPRLVISRHNCAPFFDGPLERQLEGWVLSQADRVIGISEAVRERLTHRHPGLPPGHVRTVLYGLDTAGFQASASADPAQTRAGWGIAPGEVVIGSACRLIDTKRIDVLLEAFVPLKDRARLVIVGEGPVRAELEAQARALGLGERALFTGFRSDVADVMHGFDIFAFPSEIEGFGLVLLEAMAARLPVVACDLSPMSDIVVAGETGFLAPVGDAAAFTARLATLVSDGSLRERFGRAGLARALEAFSMERMLREIRGAYDDALADPRAAARG